MLDERNVRRESRCPLVYIIEGLQIGKLNQREEGLLERIFDGRSLGENQIETLFDELGHPHWMKDRASDLDDDVTETARRLRVWKQVVRKRSVKIENGISVEADVLSGIDEKLDSVLVVEDHLRFSLVFPFRFLADLD